MRFRMRERFQTEGELDGLPPHALLNILCWNTTVPCLTIISVGTACTPAADARS